MKKDRLNLYFSRNTNIIFYFYNIIDWSDNDVWEFLHYYGCNSNPLYQCGYSRIGCVGCPNSYKRKQEFERYPKFTENYIKTFDRMLQHDFYKTKNRPGTVVKKFLIGG